MDDIPNKIQTQLGIICDVDLHEENGKRYIAIDVKPYDVPMSYQRKYHYRCGSTKQEAWGRGTLKIVDECKKAGLPEPDIEKNSGKHINQSKNSVTLLAPVSIIFVISY